MLFAESTRDWSISLSPGRPVGCNSLRSCGGPRPPRTGISRALLAVFFCLWNADRHESSVATSGFPGCVAAVHSSETGITVQRKSEHHNEYEQQRVSQWEATHKLQRQHNASHTPSGALHRSMAQSVMQNSQPASPEAETAREHHSI